MFCRPIPPICWAWLAFGSLVSLSPAAEEPKTPEKHEQSFNVTQWTSEDGLPQNRISALAQTRDGYLWVGTWFGLARFDGVRFVVFNSANTPEFKHEAVTALAVDRADGALWIGTREGLLRLKDGQFTRPTGRHEMSQWYVSRLTAAAGGGVWVDAGGQVVFHRDQLSVGAAIDFANDERLQAERETEEQSLAVATSGRLRQVARDGTVKRWELPTGGPTNEWIAGWLPKDRLGRVWLSMHDRLLRFAEGQWHELQTWPGRSAPSDHFLEDRAGAVWAACDQAGLWRFSETGAQRIRFSASGAEKRITCMLQDIEGQVWVGAQQGLFQLRPRLIRAVTTEQGLPQDECWSVCEAPDGAIWTETAQGVARILDEHAQTFPDEPGRTCWRNVLVDTTGAVWLGNRHDGLIVWRPGAETNWFWSEKQKATVGALYLGRDGRVWVGTDRGVTWFENGQPAAGWGEFGLPTNSVRSIYQTRDGTMWFGTWQAGAVRWRSADFLSAVSRASNPPAAGQFQTARATDPPADWKPATPQVGTPSYFTTADGLADDRVFVFHEAADGALWIGTHHGLSRLTFSQRATLNPQPSIFTFRTEHGLLDNLINWFEEDDFGRLWFSCNRGIFHIERQDLNAVADGKKARANVAVYGTADGMPSPETNGEHQPAGCKDRKGRLWFPTQQGVVMIDPRKLEGNDSSPPVVIEQIMVDKEVVYGDGFKVHNPKSETPDQELRLPPGSAGLLRIRYTANSFADPRRVRFRYQLVGLDQDWREDTDERVAYYTDLRPRRYQFRVKAANPHGVWNETPAEFAFSVAPHFWETWPFYGGCAFLVISLAAGVQSYRLRWQRRVLKLEHDTALATERARIARDLHDDLGTALTGLALELDVIGRNPQSGTELTQRLNETSSRTRGLAEQMREVVWTVNPKCDNVSSLADFLEQQVRHFLRGDGLRVRSEFPEDIPDLPLSAEARHQLALSVREALTNVVRHAQATEAELTMSIIGQTLRVQVKDNGRGFVPTQTNGHGLANMRARLEKTGGGFECVSTPGAGAKITFSLPLRHPTAENG